MPLKDLPAESRPREKLLARGPQALSDAELLAIVLRTGIKGKGVLELAQELITPHADIVHAAQAIPGVAEPIPPPPPSRTTGFAGISGLLNASGSDLKRIKGLGPAKRAELVAVLELSRRALTEQLSRDTIFDSPQAVKQFLQLHLAAKRHEVFVVLFVDSLNRLITMEELFRGTLTQASVYPREVVVRALHHHCAGVILAHNHPSGNTAPSASDIQLTQLLKTTLALVDVRVLDHFIVAPGAALSMAESGHM
ncbi:DNA repair protein RadC [Diaphorobacter sp. NR2-3-3-1]|nr:DNA repair protein RadC [Diaphorobacter caeni]MBF5003116.1 DNA repair protein RadC [Diaphorobacter caeni]